MRLCASASSYIHRTLWCIWLTACGIYAGVSGTRSQNVILSRQSFVLRVRQSVSPFRPPACMFCVFHVACSYLCLEWLACFVPCFVLCFVPRVLAHKKTKKKRNVLMTLSVCVCVCVCICMFFVRIKACESLATIPTPHNRPFAYRSPKKTAAQKFRSTRSCPREVVVIVVMALLRRGFFPDTDYNIIICDVENHAKICKNRVGVGLWVWNMCST